MTMIILLVMMFCVMLHQDMYSGVCVCRTSANMSSVWVCMCCREKKNASLTENSLLIDHQKKQHNGIVLKPAKVTITFDHLSPRLHLMYIPTLLLQIWLSLLQLTHLRCDFFRFEILRWGIYDPTGVAKTMHDMYCQFIFTLYAILMLANSLPCPF